MRKTEDSLCRNSVAGGVFLDSVPSLAAIWAGSVRPIDQRIYTVARTVQRRVSFGRRACLSELCRRLNDRFGEAGPSAVGRTGPVDIRLGSVKYGLSTTHPRLSETTHTYCAN